MLKCSDEILGANYGLDKGFEESMLGFMLILQTKYLLLSRH